MPHEPTNREILTSVQDLADAVQILSSNTDRQFKRVDEQLQEMKSEIISHVDWFATQHNRYDTELISLRSASLRHEERITTLEERAS